MWPAAVAFFLAACQMPGLAPAASPADPWQPFRPTLQPWAQEALAGGAPLPHYAIRAALSADGAALAGQMELRLPWPGDEVVFRLYPNFPHYQGRLTISAVRLDGQDLPIVTAVDDTVARVALPPLAEPPDVVDLAVAFSAELPRPGGSYTLFGWHDQTLSLPGFYPTLAGRDGQDWVVEVPPRYADVLFSQTAYYELYLTAPETLALAGSGAVLDSAANGDGTRTWYVAGGPLRDLTLVLGPFQTLSEQAAGATVTSFFLPGDEPAAAAALSHAAAALRLFADAYGPYPYTELDVVEAPLNFRGMEYSGLILLGQDLYGAQRSHLTFLTAHEVAHQWWYALVGNDPYRYPWLDEGLAEYSAFDYYRGVFGQPAAEELLVQRWQIPYDVHGGPAGVVDQPAAAFDESNYELLVYAKAALFFNALRTTLGEENYRAVIQAYVAENRFGIATPQTLLATAQRVSGQNLNPLVEEWLR